MIAEETLTLFYVRDLVTTQVRPPLRDEFFYRIPVHVQHFS